MLIQVHHQQKADWRKCNSAAKPGSYLVMRGTEKVEVPKILGMVFTSKVWYQASQVSASSCKV